jgi:hypothetical protein
VSRVITTLKGGLEAWRTRSLTDLDVIYVYVEIDGWQKIRAVLNQHTAVAA